ncbi:type II secretion system F family protein [Hoeflea poritis]|uniref:Type II secretion system F family protein n=1 Tax=Hoeflea poritis TaxID=2993659 RepID=A0ABT4VT93_9HYPH|nr:type II secretion system F family protein [Hoeflea poritis]MDA4847938.1 type II secretion system F family protein [Hoeflea poritis]
MIKTLTDPTLVSAVLVGIAVFATMVTIFMPFFERGDLKARMKSVALERDEIRARERARLNAEANSRGSLRHDNNTSIRQFVDRLNLREALVDSTTVKKMRIAGFRTQNALNIFLFARFTLPFLFLAAAVAYVFWLDGLSEQPTAMRVLFCVGAAYLGFYAPNIYVSNKTQKRQKSIRIAWPDALDLMLICVESGVSIEAAFRRVADEVANQSAPLAEELVLTTAELSYLDERRKGFENLGERTGLEPVKSVCQALIQAERYGTPVAQALRVLAQESRDMRMTEAEKKAAALPPKLTVPMILFFLPVIFGVILGPAMMSVFDTI